ncbi:hypothetical protein RYX36_018543 [Vicia faba]
MKHTYTQGRCKTVAQKNFTPKVDYYDDEGSNVKEFYANLVNTNNKRVEVVVRGVKVSYSEGKVDMFFKLGNREDRYQEILTPYDDADYDVYMESM